MLSRQIISSLKVRCVECSREELIDALSLTRCLYWPHGGRVFGHMVDTLGASLKLANDSLLEQFFTHSPRRFGAVGEKLEFWIRARTTMRRGGQRWFAAPRGASCGHAPLAWTRSSHDGELRRSICLI